MAGSSGGRKGSGRSGGGTVADAPAKLAKGPQKVDYNAALSLVSAKQKAQRNLRNRDYSYNGNGAWSLQSDRRMAKGSLQSLSRDRIRYALGVLRRTQYDIRNPYDSDEGRARARRDVVRMRADVVRAVRGARAFNEPYRAETVRRWDARLAKRKSRAAS